MWNDNKDCVGQPKIIIPLSNAIWPGSSASAHYPDTIDESFLLSLGSFSY